MSHRLRWLSLLPLLLILLFATSIVHAEGDQSPASAANGKLVLASYFPWFDDNTWYAGVTADLPAPLYNSDDHATISRHVEQALHHGIDGFVSAYYFPGDRTDHNLAQILERSRGTRFRSTVALQIGLDGQSGEVLATTIHHIVASYGSHPNFLKHDGKPVLFFTNLNRLPVSAARLRAMVDPGYNQVWIAEGLNFGVLNQFDGINVLKVMHAGLPTDYLKAPRWAANTRAYGDKLWVATVMPGWDDSRVRDTGNSLRNVSTPFSANRQDGGVFVASWAAALSSNPDWILINSFNEWIEGTQIEPSQSYGPRYLEILAALRPEFQ